MTWRDALLCAAALVAAVSVSDAETQRVQSDQEILTQLERDWDDAFHRRDVAFIENVLADEFMATYADGTRVNRAEELALIAKSNQRVVSSTVDEFTVNVYGDTAVVWFTQHLLGQSQGQQLALAYRYVDVFVMREGRWQCVASQSTKVDAAL